MRETRSVAAGCVLSMLLSRWLPCWTGPCLDALQVGTPSHFLDEPANIELIIIADENLKSLTLPFLSCRKYCRCLWNDFERTCRGSKYRSDSDVTCSEANSRQVGNEFRSGLTLWPSSHSNNLACGWNKATKGKERERETTQSLLAQISPALFFIFTICVRPFHSFWRTLCLSVGFRSGPLCLCLGSTHQDRMMRLPGCVLRQAWLFKQLQQRPQQKPLVTLRFHQWILWYYVVVCKPVAPVLPMPQ